MGVSAMALMFLSAMNADAQKAEFGFRFMPTISSFELKTYTGGTVKGDATFGFGVSALLGYNFNSNIGIQTELVYSSLAQKYKELDLERKITLQYINIPVLLTMNTGRTKPVNFNLVVGPQAGISVGSKIQTTNSLGITHTNALVSVKKGDIALAYGGGVDFALTKSHDLRLGIGFRGTYGLLDISDNSSTIITDTYYVLDKSHIKTYSAYAGITFLF